MGYIRFVSENEAEGKLVGFYDVDRKAMGFVPAYTQAMSLRPDAIAAWRQLSTAIRSNMRLRRYELVTFAAAQALRCRY